MRILRVSLLLASLALPAAAQSRFGLGLDLLFEHQESLEVSAFRGTILTRDLLNGGEQSGQQPSDPAFLNRKFDLVWELEGTGVELPIELPGRWGLDSRFVLQAGVADVSLDFIGLRDRADNASLSGRGPLFGAGLEVEGSPLGAGPWSWGGNLRWQKVPNLTMDRSPAFRPEGFEVTADGVQLSQQGFEVVADNVRLSQEIQELTTLVGYSVSGRTTSYVGVRHRRTNVTIADELGYLDPLREIETRLASNADLESEATLAIAGVEAHLGSRFYGRMETAIGEGDRVVQAAVVYFLPEVKTREELEEARREAEIAVAIAPPLAEIEAEFLAGWRSLSVVEGPGGNSAYLVSELGALLSRTEGDLLAVLDRYPELEALGDWVQYAFGRARIELRLEGNTTAFGRELRVPMSDVLTLLASYVPRKAASFTGFQAKNTVDQDEADAKLAELAEKPVAAVAQMPANGLRIQLTFRTPLGRGTTLFVYPMLNRNSLRAQSLGRENSKSLYKGWYYFDLAKQKTPLNCCGAASNCSIGDCPLDLVPGSCLVLVCDEAECRERRNCR